MPNAVHPYFKSIYSKDPRSAQAKQLNGLIAEISGKDDADDFTDSIDEFIDDNLPGYWISDDEAYRLDEDNTFGDKVDAREYWKEEMSAAQWIDTIVAALELRAGNIDYSNKKGEEYRINVAERLTKQDVRLMVDMLQDSYETHCQEEDDFNPFLYEQKLIKADLPELVEHFIETFRLPSPMIVASADLSLEWMPDSLAEAFGLREMRDSLRALQLNSARLSQLRNLIEKIDTDFHRDHTLEHLCRDLSIRIPKHRQILNQIEELIDSWKFT